MNRETSSVQVAGPRLFVASGAVKRVHRREKYIPRDYEVCLCREGGSQWYFFPNWRVSVDQDPSKAALEHLQQQTALKGAIAHPLTVFGKPVSDHSIALFYAVPVSHNDTIDTASANYYEFHCLADVLENSGNIYDLKLGHVEMLHALDRWLHERHVIPFVDPDLVFLCSQEGEGIGGLVKAIIENPVYNAHIRPPEDDLVISLNNPVFDTGGQDVSTALASNV